MEQRVVASFSAQGLMDTLGARLVRVVEGEVHIALPFAQHLSQHQGFVHAGAITSVVDSACGYAALTKAAPQTDVVTVEFKANFLRPALGTHFLAVGKVQNAGKLLAVCTGEIRAFADQGSENYKIVALMQATIAYVSATRT